MPRSKLGLHLTVEQLCKRKNFNPMSELIETLKEKDAEGNYVCKGRERLAGLTVLINKMKATPKPIEPVTNTDRKMEINRVTFTLGSADPNGAVVTEVPPDAA